MYNTLPEDERHIEDMNSDIDGVRVIRAIEDQLNRFQFSAAPTS